MTAPMPPAPPAGAFLASPLMAPDAVQAWARALCARQDWPAHARDAMRTMGPGATRRWETPSRAHCEQLRTLQRLTYLHCAALAEELAAEATLGSASLNEGADLAWRCGAQLILSLDEAHALVCGDAQGDRSARQQHSEFLLGIVMVAQAIGAGAPVGHDDLNEAARGIVAGARAGMLARCAERARRVGRSLA